MTSDFSLQNGLYIINITYSSIFPKIFIYLFCFPNIDLALISPTCHIYIQERTVIFNICVMHYAHQIIT